MKCIETKAYAKVNLLLDVLCRRPDGYHELEGIMQSISLCDTVRIAPSDTIEVVSDVPLPHDNTCRRAAEAFLFASGRGCRIEVTKRIPSEAGLGGASADAAAVLRGLNMLYRGSELEKSDAELYKIGLSVGADVPFCLMRGCAIARGVGEELTPIKGPRLHLLIVRGRRGVSTGRLFSSLKVGSEKKSRLKEGALDIALAAIENGDVRELASGLENALMPAACADVPEIGEYVKRMLSLGALGACMTGSGAAVFGVFESAEAAKEAQTHFADCDFADTAVSFPSPAPACTVFRRAGADDALLTAALRREAWLTTYRGIYPDELLDNFDLEARAVHDRARLEDPKQLGFIIEADNTPCGFIFLHGTDFLHVDALYLLKEYRGLGIGREAFGLFRGLAREKGLSRFTCNCNAYNLPALKFYQRMGGREISRDTGHENKREDQIGFEFDA